MTITITPADLHTIIGACKKANEDRYRGLAEWLGRQQRHMFDPSDIRKKMDELEKQFPMPTTHSIINDLS